MEEHQRYKLVRAAFVASQLIMLVMSMVHLVLYVDTGKLFEELKKVDARVDAHLLIRFILVTALCISVLITMGWIAASLYHKRCWLIVYVIFACFLIPCDLMAKQDDEKLRHFHLIQSIPFAFSAVLAFVQSHMIARKLHLDSLSVGVYYPAPDQVKSSA